MAKTTVVSKKKRGPPPTGKGTPIMTRLQPPQIAALDTWIARQREPMSRPEAIRRLVEAGLAASPSTQPQSKKIAARAAGVAAREINHIADPNVPASERQSRKRALIQGPEEFRDLRAKKPRKR